MFRRKVTNQFSEPIVPIDYPNLANDRLLIEIKENRRRINNLCKRILRLESYLRIRDTSDYQMLDEDNVFNNLN